MAESRPPGKAVGATRVVSPGLIGRAEELELLASAVSAPPAVVLVDGEAGVGKTRLMKELQARVDVRFLTGGCRPIRDPFPLGSVLESVRGLGDQLGDLELSPVVGALRPLLPELVESLPPGLEPLDDRSAERHRVFRGLAEVLTALGPGVVVLEDIHWADEQTIDFLRYLLDDPPPTLSVVVTFRGEELPPGSRTPGMRLPPAVTTELDLAPLDAEQTGALAAAIVGTDRVSPEFARYLHERTAGLPFAIEEVMALLRERSAVTRRGERWARRALSDLGVPRAIKGHVLERVSRLPQVARSMIEAAAVLQSPASDKLIGAVSGHPPPTAAAGLSRALASGIMVEYGDLVGFRHMLASEAIYDAIPGPRRRELHDRAGDQTSRLGSAALGQVAHHLRKAGRLDEWAVASEQAADQAIDLGHDDEAVRLLHDVLREMPDDLDGRGRIATKLASAAIDAARGGDVLDLLRRELEQGPPQESRGELRFYVAILMDNSGVDPAVTYRLLAEAVTDLDGRPDLKVWAMIGLGLPRTAGVPIAEHLTWLRRAVRCLRDVDDPAFEMFARGKIAMILVSIGDPEWRSLADHIVGQTDGEPRRHREVVAYGSVGLGACYTGHHEIAGRLLDAAETGADSLENPHPLLTVRAAKAVLHYFTGAWDEFDSQLAPLLDQLDGQPRQLIDLEVVSGCLALARGELDSHRTLTNLVDQLLEMGGVELLAVPASVLMRAAIARGDHDAALKEADRLLTALDPRTSWVPATRALPALVQTFVAADRLDEARDTTDRFGSVFRELDAPLLEPGMRYARGVLALTVGDPSSAAQHLTAAATAYDGLACPYEAARAWEQAALALLAADASGAEPPLQTALATYRRLDARWDFDRAASTARRHGVSVPARQRGGHRGYGSALSPRERQVAERAATGLSNKEIASELYLSPETVKKHMQAAMRKLGVHSRAALAGRLDR